MNIYLYTVACYIHDYISTTITHTYVTILYVAWADQRDKVYFIFHKVQGCCMDTKAQL